MIRTALAFALAVTPTLATAQAAAPQLGVEHRMLVRCSAAFALVAYRQDNGNAEAMRYPAMAERGREFFVRASAQVMDEAGLDRDQIQAALSAEAQDMVDNGTLDQVVPVCLNLLPEE
ncbi:hypothetical protein [Aurantiacibacter gilvus]|uniref:Uncharacterized protein n=1 Tax=Aurantiacibacter gilvus TaxID=3139141 RepID=A0ABU9IGH7_9SPHN